MYDTARRVALVKQRVRENTRRRQRREAISLSAACMLLFAALPRAAGTVVGPGQTAAWGVFGAMLLREDAGGYVLVAVVSFAAAAVITALCFRLRNRENQKKDGADKPDPTRTGGEKPMKKRILSILLLCCMVLTLLPTTAFATGELRDSTNVTVTFDSDGGSAVEPQSVPQGQPAQRPADPVKEGYTFIGWYDKNDLDNKYYNMPEWNFRLFCD